MWFISVISLDGYGDFSMSLRRHGAYFLLANMRLFLSAEDAKGDRLSQQNLLGSLKTGRNEVSLHYYVLEAWRNLVAFCGGGRSHCLLLSSAESSGFLLDKTTLAGLVSKKVFLLHFFLRL